MGGKRWQLGWWREWYKSMSFSGGEGQEEVVIRRCAKTCVARGGKIDYEGESQRKTSMYGLVLF